MIDFGTIDDEGKFQSRKMRVTICGKSIYNYRSEKAVNRGGWPHFSILAKNSTLDQAIELCRNWDEFWELNILSIFQYFPTAKWLLWKGNHRRQQLLQLVISSRPCSAQHRLLTTFRDLYRTFNPHMLMKHRHGNRLDLEDTRLGGSMLLPSVETSFAVISNATIQLVGAFASICQCRLVES